MDAQRRLDEGLRESEERLRLALEAGQMGTWEWNVATGEVVWSPSLETIHGLAPGAFPGTFAAYQEDIHPEDREPILRAIARTLEQGEDHHVEYRIVRPDGSIRWVEARGKLFRDQSGVATRMIGVCTDVTERKQADEALHESEQRFARFMQQLPGLAWIKDLEGRYVFANDAAQRAFLASHAQLYGRTDDEIFPPETAARFRDNDMRALASEVGIQAFETLLQDDGVLHHSLVSKFPIAGPDGRIAFIGGIAIDITERNAAEDRIAALADDLRHRLEEQETLLRSLPVGVFIARDAQCSDIAMNPAGAALLRTPVTANASKTGPEAERLPFRVLKDGAEVAPRDLPMQRAARLGEPVSAEEMDVVFPDGSVTTLFEYASPLFDQEGAVRGCLGVFVDITERKRVEERQKLLLDELNHRVKNTLAIVQSIAVQTLRETPDPAAFKGAFSARLAALARAHSLLTKELWQGVSLRDVVSAMLAPFGGDGRQQAISIDGPPVTIKPNAAVTLSLVLHELAANAAKHGALAKPCGRVRVAWHRTGEGAGHSAGVELVWAEQGGPAVEPPKKQGFGSRLIAASADQLGGEVSLRYGAEGVEVRFRFPLPDNEGRAE
ncbi:MAG: PAS domain S-box protein [Kiloniellales bacterium]